MKFSNQFTGRISTQNRCKRISPNILTLLNGIMFISSVLIWSTTFFINTTWLTTNSFQIPHSPNNTPPLKKKQKKKILKILTKRELAKRMLMNCTCRQNEPHSFKCLYH